MVTMDGCGGVGDYPTEFQLTVNGILSSPAASAKHISPRGCESFDIPVGAMMIGREERYPESVVDMSTFVTSIITRGTNSILFQEDRLRARAVIKCNYHQLDL